MKPSYPHLSIDQPATYRITVQGWVDKDWQDWFGGMQVTQLELADDDQPNGTCSPIPFEVTILIGLVDQAALLGTLQRLYTFGLPLLSLELVSPGAHHSRS